MNIKVLVKGGVIYMSGKWHLYFVPLTFKPDSIRIIFFFMLIKTCENKEKEENRVRFFLLILSEIYDKSVLFYLN